VCADTSTVQGGGKRRVVTVSHRPVWLEPADTALSRKNRTHNNRRVLALGEHRILYRHRKSGLPFKASSPYPLNWLCFARRGDPELLGDRGDRLECLARTGRRVSVRLLQRVACSTLFFVAHIIDANLVSRAIPDRFIACHVRRAQNWYLAVVRFAALDGL
jgi:hypothetical protein